MPLPYSQPTWPGRLSATRLINLPPSHRSYTCERVLFPPVNAVQIAVCVPGLGYYSVHGKVWGVGRVRSVKVKFFCLFFQDPAVHTDMLLCLQLFGQTVRPTQHE